ncbi:GNAT family N-acetyltransferase [Sutcliffiella halmapala]|uniref:GNAT family N-acetyltransferase n=1 Tax=Sutcliffiella halmapala TaxID=79882 RepID=UPI001F1BACB5|nr:GNAT family N-acetyltransferase [Sutcliffiella halmapala]
MILSIQKMTKKCAEEILQWRYEPPYDFYNNECTEEALHEMLDNPYLVVVSNGEVIGFFCLGQAAQVPAGDRVNAYKEAWCDIGLGMKPDITGSGRGTEFFSFVLKYVEEEYESTPVRLTVATFNKRAIHLYSKMGFEKGVEFQHNSVSFMTMVKKVGEN